MHPRKHLVPRKRFYSKNYNAADVQRVTDTWKENYLAAHKQLTANGYVLYSMESHREYVYVHSVSGVMVNLKRDIGKFAWRLET